MAVLECVRDDVVEDDDELEFTRLMQAGQVFQSTRAPADLRMKNKMARLLVARASKTMMKKKARHTKNRSLTEPLFSQLECLRNLVPYSRKGENSCVVADAMIYLDQLSKKLDELAKPKIKVEVKPLGKKLRIHLSCEKKPGLMGNLLALLDGLGFVFDNLNVSSKDGNLTLDALTTMMDGQVGGAHVSAGKLKMILLRSLLINRRDQSLSRQSEKGCIIYTGSKDAHVTQTRTLS